MARQGEAASGGVKPDQINGGPQAAGQIFLCVTSLADPRPAEADRTDMPAGNPTWSIVNSIIPRVKHPAKALSFQKDLQFISSGYVILCRHCHAGRDHVHKFVLELLIHPDHISKAAVALQEMF